ncbi:MAG: serine/threonine-protein kinase [Planctomycetota bacterium]
MLEPEQIMGILDKFKNVFSADKKLGLLDVGARFTLDRHAFTGTMSKFHVATEIGTGKRLGIKLLDEEKLAYFRSRFKGLNKPDEGAIGSRMDHEQIVKTLEYGKTLTGQDYILMEYVHGPGVNVVIKNQEPKAVANRLKLIRQMADAIQHVHDRGFIHRDICPRNFICHEDYDWLKLIDFGLSIPNEAPFRQPGNRTGTPQYMAPEIVRRRQTDERTDIFAFGVTAYRFLTWEHPWGSTDTTGTAALVHDTKEPRSIFDHRPDLNEKLGKAIHRCIAVKPDHRPPSMKKFLSSIREVKTETA